MAELVKKITKQIEYYFGDFNLSKDKFLRDLTGKEDGWIPINTLLTFKRLKAITEKVSDIVEAFENGKNEIVELNETKDKLRRSKPLPNVEDEEYKKDYRLRTVHIKGFPKEDTTLDELIEFCSKYGHVESVQMRRFDDKTFKGCCMVLFKDIESANRAISSNDLFKDEIELKLRENKETYLKRKRSGKKGDFKKENNKLVNLNVNEDKNQNDEQKNLESEQKEKEKPFEYENGCIIKLIDLPEDLKYFDIKSNLKKHAKVQYVDIYPESKICIVRFASKEETNKALKELNFTENDKIKENGESKTENSATETVDEKMKDENQEIENQADDLKTEENNQEPLSENLETNKQAEDEDKMPNETGQKTTVGKIKIDKDLVLNYAVLEGDEEKEYWLKVKSLNSGSKDSHNKGHKRYNQNNKRKFGGFKNKNKRSANDDRANSKKAKIGN